MGLDTDVAKFLLGARERKVDFQKTIMLGNQWFKVPESDLHYLKKLFGLEDSFTKISDSWKFLEFIGAKEVSAMDISDYENADVLHDLNEPIGDDLKEKYTFILDGGTLEHVFNFPIALSNAMQMVKVGGHLATIEGGNNFFGHGFYQLSPELFYRALSEENGFTVKRMIAAEVGGDWYEVSDPKKVRSRVELSNAKPTYLMTLAEKTSSVKPFGKMPQQSDYQAMWETEDAKNNSGNASGGIKNLLKRNRFLYKTLAKIKQSQINYLIRKERSFANKTVYKQVEK